METLQVRAGTHFLSMASAAHFTANCTRPRRTAVVSCAHYSATRMRGGCGSFLQNQFVCKVDDLSMPIAPPSVQALQESEIAGRIAFQGSQLDLRVADVFP